MKADLIEQGDPFSRKVSLLASSSLFSRPPSKGGIERIYNRPLAVTMLLLKGNEALIIFCPLLGKRIPAEPYLIEQIDPFSRKAPLLATTSLLSCPLSKSGVRRIHDRHVTMSMLLFKGQEPSVHLVQLLGTRTPVESDPVK